MVVESTQNTNIIHLQFGKRSKLPLVRINIPWSTDVKTIATNAAVFVEIKSKQFSIMFQIQFKKREYGRLSIRFAGAFLIGSIFSFLIFDKILSTVIEKVSIFVFFCFSMTIQQNINVFFWIFWNYRYLKMRSKILHTESEFEAGLFWTKDLWEFTISVNGKNLHIRYFEQRWSKKWGKTAFLANRTICVWVRILYAC